MAAARRERDDVEAALKSKGFVPKNSDHRHFTYWSLAGKKTSVWTKTSYGTKYKVLGQPLIAAMATQCKLSKGQFLELVDCPMTQEAYETVLFENGKIG